MGKIWIISDLHFCHNKDFIYGKRGFNSIAEHDEEEAGELIGSHGGTVGTDHQSGNAHFGKSAGSGGEEGGGNI